MQRRPHAAPRTAPRGAAHDSLPFVFVCPQCATTYPSDAACPHDGVIPLRAATDALLGTTIGSYRIAAKIGSGGMGTVYRAVHPGIGSRVAIKVLSHDSSRDNETVNRFFDEARTVNLIRHDNIVNILDVARLPDGRPYIIMELLDGVSLKSALRQGPMAVAEVGRIAVAVLDALAAAHEHGVAHRDLKPDNIMVSPSGRITLVDFGIAKIAGSRPDAVRTETGVILGTPQYMSPEQAQGRTIDARTDVYAMGIVMYEMLTGVRPFEGNSLFEILRQQISEPPRPPSQRAAVPADLEQIILLAMAKAPEQRFSTARAMQAAVCHATGITMQASRWPTAPLAPATALAPGLATNSAATAVLAAPGPALSTSAAATTNLRPPRLAADHSPPPAHASSFSMIATSGNRTKKSTWLIAAGSIAILTAVAIPVLRARQPSIPSATPATWQGSAASPTGATGIIAPVNFATTPVAAIAVCQELQQALNVTLACPGVEPFLRQRMRAIYLDFTVQYPDGRWCNAGLSESRRYATDGGCAAKLAPPAVRATPGTVGLPTTSPTPAPGPNPATAVPNSAALDAAIAQITSREELRVATFSKDPLQAQAAQIILARQRDPASPFVENDRLEIAIDDFAAYAYTRARSLAPDAQLVTLEFRGLRQNGLISTKDDFGSAIATFFSPRRSLRPASIDPKIAWTPLATITIEFGHLGTTSQWTWSTDTASPKPLPMPTCKPSQLWNKARQRHPTVDKMEKMFGLRIMYETAGTWTMPTVLTKLPDDCT